MPAALNHELHESHELKLGLGIAYAIANLANGGELRLGTWVVVPVGRTASHVAWFVLLVARVGFCIGVVFWVCLGR